MVQTKLISGKQYVPVKIEIMDDRMYFHFGYSKPLIDEIKVVFEGRKYHGFDEINPRKIWSAPITQRNMFALEALKGKYGNDPYSRWSPTPPELLQEVKDYARKSGRNPFDHQYEAIAQGLHTKRFLWALEMGLGKTLCAIILMEMSGIDEWYWLGPKSALRALYVELRTWGCKVKPKIITYEELKKDLSMWTKGIAPPMGVIADEISKCKNLTAQRTMAMKHLADAMRNEHGDSAIIGGMSGSPATKSPADWFSLLEIIQPGFLREGSIQEFKSRLSVIEQREQAIGGGTYPHLIGWKDNAEKCSTCLELKSHSNHTSEFAHVWTPSVNEVANLYKRMAGLVLPRFKRDCLDLPELIFDIARAKPSESTLRAAGLIARTSRRAVEALTRLRELSDGFQYIDITEGTHVCDNCHGKKKCHEFFDPLYPDLPADPDDITSGTRTLYDDDYNPIGTAPCKYEARIVECYLCGGSGEVPSIVRSIERVDTPKDEMLMEQFDLHDEFGRLNVYAGFTASVDRVVSVAHANGWGTIRVDGRGWLLQTEKGDIVPDDGHYLDIYQQGQREYPRLCFVGQPGAAGMGITLTAAPTTIFYSNDFNADSRIQAESRGHRIGMDVERGGHILDFVHLPSDEYVLTNLKRKKRLQELSLTGITSIIDTALSSSEKGHYR